MTLSVLVTGGAGYIGSHTCKALAEAGHRPVAYDDLSTGGRWAARWGPIEIGDICDPVRLDEAMLRHRPAAVVHFAARALVGESVLDPAKYYRENTGGSLEVADACRRHGVRAFVFSSTCAVYGAPSTGPITEATPPAPINPYGASKLATERMLSEFDAAYGFPHMSLRYFNAAGADAAAALGERREVETHLIPLALDAALGRRPPLDVYGDDFPTPDGTAVRDYVHVSDLADAHVKALDHLLCGGSSRVLNIGTGRGYSVRQVIKAVARTAGAAVPHRIAPRRPGDPPDLVADATEALLFFGGDLFRRSDLETIVRSAWEWRRSMPDGESVARRL